MTDLRQVFELCSPDNEGFILTEALAEKLSEQFSDNDLDTIQSALDPERKGRISFNKFETIVSNLQNGVELTPQIAEENTNNILMTKTLENDECASSSDPENTYNEYDMADDEFGENFEAMGESVERFSRTLSPSSNFSRNSSFRKSHRRNHSYQRDELLFRDETASVTSDFDDLSEKVDCLKDQVSRLEEEKNVQIQYESVKHEKQQLAMRNHELEERLNTSIENCENVKQEADAKIRELQMKLEREAELKLEVLQNKLQSSDTERSRLTEELQTTRETSAKLREDNQRLQTKVEGLTAQVLQTNEEYRLLNQQSNSQRDKLEEKLHLVNADNETLHEQLQELHADKCALVERLSGLELQGRPNMELLASKLSTLEGENERLKTANEDLNMQLARNIVGARSLMGDQTEQNSIADEMRSATRDEVVEALEKKESENIQLRQYLDKIILSVLERDPSILEIK